MYVVAYLFNVYVGSHGECGHIYTVSAALQTKTLEKEWQTETLATVFQKVSGQIIS